MVAVTVLESCNACERCVEVCPFAVFEIVDGFAIAVRSDDCIECCACVKECPKDAILINSCD